MVVDQLMALGQNALDEQGISWPDALYIGLACPGQIDRWVLILYHYPLWQRFLLAYLSEIEIIHVA